MNNPYQVVADFEGRLAEYTGAPHVVCVHSCTSALMLAVAWHLRIPQPPTIMECLRGQFTKRLIEIPRKTYCSVPMAIIRAGGSPTFHDEDWLGRYRLNPLPVWDSARWFTSGLYADSCVIDGHAVETMRGEMVCCSFHASKTLGLEYGGAVLHDNPEADKWFRKARFHGRSEGVAPKDDTFDMLGFDCRMHPSTAAQGILKLHSLPRHNEPLPNDPYPDLSCMSIFK